MSTRQDNVTGAPKISIVMPVYNGEKYIKEATLSILEQSFSEFEFIIIDDNSTDQTPTIIKSLADSRIILIKNDSQCGIAKSLNIGIARARGKYIARMDADDISHRRRLQTQFNYMECHPNIAISGTWVQTLNTKNNSIKIWKKPIHDEEIKALMAFSCPLIHPTVMFRREILDTLNLHYNESYRSAQDYELWSQAMDHVKFANIPKVLLTYRLHNESVTSTTSAHQKENTEIIQKYILDKMVMARPPSIHESLETYEQWLLKFRDKSKLKDFCSARTRHAIFSKIWLSACLGRAQQGSQIIKIYWSSQLRENSFKNLVKFGGLLVIVMWSKIY